MIVISRAIIMVFLLVLLTACGLSPVSSIVIESSGVRVAKVSQLTAGDLNASCVCDIPTGDTTSQVTITITNHGSQADRLLKVESDVAGRVELRQVGGADAPSSLFPVNSVLIPAKRQVEFRPGQYYMILTGLKRDLRVGDTVNLSLFFEKAGKLTAQVPVTPKP